MARRKLEELNLLDDFLFGTMLSYKGVGERFARELLRTIMHREFNNLKIIPQKVYYGKDTDKHGAYLDVFIEENGDEQNATICDIEAEQKYDGRADMLLPRRVRFYHAKIDAESLNSGEDYKSLKNVLIIMILPFDPFGRDQMVYTIGNKCEEVLDMPYDDGAKTLFLYTKGTKGNPPQELRELLHYMEKTTEENAVNRSLKEIHNMVTQVKQDREVSIGFMKWYEKEQMLIRKGRQEQEAETEKQRQRAEAEKQRADSAEQRADSAEQQAYIEKQRADNAEQRAEAAEAELKLLKAKLGTF